MPIIEVESDSRGDTLEENLVTDTILEGSTTILVDTKANRTTLNGESARHRRQSKVLRAHDKLIYTIDSDVNAERIQGLTDYALLGRVEHSGVSHSFLKDWVIMNWKLILHYTPLFSILANGWYLFHLLSISDREIIFSRVWLISKGSMAFTRWHIGFDPHHERIVKRHLWVVFPDFPIHLWSREVFIGLANHLGTFIHMENSMLWGYDKQKALVLVELDVSRGLFLEVEVHWKGHSFV